MDLHFIKTKACPHCGCSVVIEESVTPDAFGMSVLTHCSGGQWETRKFLCGHTVSYVPNYHKEESTGECRFNKAYLERQEKRKKAEEALKAFIDALDCDDDYKRDLRSHLPW